MLAQVGCCLWLWSGIGVSFGVLVTALDVVVGVLILVICYFGLLLWVMVACYRYLMLVGLLLCGLVLVVCRLLICADCLCYVNSVGLCSSLVYTIVALLCACLCWWRRLWVWLLLGFVYLVYVGFCVYF